MAARHDGARWFTRAMMTFARASASGTLCVRGVGGRTATIELVRGRIRAIAASTGSGRVLGDCLEGESVLAACVEEEGRHDHEPIGAFLVRRGRVTRGAVQHALRRQQRERLRALIRWDELEWDFTPAPLESDDELPSMADAIVDALRARGRDDSARIGQFPEAGVAYRLGEGAIAMLAEAALRPAERGFCELVRAGRDDEWRRLVSTHDDARDFACAMLRTGLLERGASSGSHATLLAVRQQLKRSGDAASMLGVGPDSTRADARKALRKIAGAIHPDRFDGRADSAARAVSSEVLKHLLDAESRLAPARGRR